MKHAEQTNEKLDKIQELQRKQAAAARMEKRLKAKGSTAESFKEQKEQLRKQINELRKG